MTIAADDMALIKEELAALLLSSSLLFSSSFSGDANNTDVLVPAVGPNNVALEYSLLFLLDAEEVRAGSGT